MNFSCVRISSGWFCRVSLNLYFGRARSLLGILFHIPLVLCLCLKLVINQYFPIIIIDQFLFCLFLKYWKNVFCNGIIDYLSKYKILSYNQFCFHKHYSTKCILALLYDKISLAINSNEVTDGIFSDLSKASDSVNHQNSFWLSKKKTTICPI